FLLVSRSRSLVALVQGPQAIDVVVAVELVPAIGRLDELEPPQLALGVEAGTEREDAAAERAGAVYPTTIARIEVAAPPALVTEHHHAPTDAERDERLRLVVEVDGVGADETHEFRRALPRPLADPPHVRVG